MKILVTGGREYKNRTAAFSALDAAHAARPITALCQGGARGADQWAREWCAERGVHCTTYEANWDLFSRAAGYIRNQQMLDEFQPEGVIAFPGGWNTHDMVSRTLKAHIYLWMPV